MAALHFAERTRQQEKLLEYQPPAGKLKRLKISGEVDVFVCVAYLRKPVFFPEALGKHLGKLVAAGVKCLPHRVHDQLLRKPRCEPVQGNDPASNAAGRVLRLMHGV